MATELGGTGDRVNVNGGAIALGHPIGASGARVLTTLLYAMRDRGARTGLATLCLGGGDAVALSVERVGPERPRWPIGSPSSARARWAMASRTSLRSTASTVTLIDVSTEALTRARATIASNLDRQVKKGAIDAAAKDATLGRIATAATLDAVADASLIVEAASEDTTLKFKLFAELDRLASPGAILASNTSSISITRDRSPYAAARCM